MHNHNHSHCHHENVKYCPHCDVCYCLNCNKEWGKYSFTYTPIKWYYYAVPYTVTWESNGVYTLTNSSGMKVTDSSVVNAFQNSTEYKNVIGNKTVCTHN